MDAITLLKQDHQDVSKLFKEFENLDDAAEKEGVVATIIEELTRHAFVEETIFYPFAREQVPDVESDVQEGINEHHLMKVTMSELLAMGPDDEDYSAKVTVLKEVVEHHVDEEEHEWFPKVRDAIGRNDLADVGEQLEAAKADAPDRPDPSE
jgi:hemerythrin superfamily protein